MDLDSYSDAARMIDELYDYFDSNRIDHLDLTRTFSRLHEYLYLVLMNRQFIFVEGGE